MKKILVVAHVTNTPGPVQFVGEYFEKKGYEVHKIYHPLDNNPISAYIVNDKSKDLVHKRFCGIKRLFFDFYYTYKILKKIRKEKFEYVIGMNCFDMLSIILFKQLINARKKIFFNVDFSRNRFANKVLNKIYVLIDKSVASKSDVLCCNTQRTIQERVREGVPAEKIIYTPNGVFWDKFNIYIKEKTDINKAIIFVGSLSKEHGLQEVIPLLKKIQIKFYIIGSGDYEDELKKMAMLHDLLDERIFFLGHMKHEEVIEYLSNFNGFGIAPYSLYSDWVYYCDPVKVKEYLALRLPVIISSVPEISETISQKEIGFRYSNITDLTHILKKLSTYSNEEYLQNIANINNFSDSIDLNTIYSKLKAL